MRRNYHQLFACKALLPWCVAAQLRVRVWDPGCNYDYVQHPHHILQPPSWSLFARRVRRLRDALAAPDCLQSFALWQDWYKRSFLLQLEDNKLDFECRYASLTQLAMQVSASLVPNATGIQLSKCKAGFQKAAYRAALSSIEQDAESRMRTKLRRWNLNSEDMCRTLSLTAYQSTPNWTARRALHTLCLVRQHVTPRVAAAVWGTMWNRWTTTARCEQRSSRCLLCDEDSALDKIEHYCRCPVVKDLGVRHLKLDASRYFNIRTFTGTNPHTRSVEDVQMCSLLVYATYRATNFQRHASSALDRNQLHDAMKQWCREGCFGHLGCMKALSDRWKRAAASTPLPNMPPVPVLLDMNRPTRKRDRS